MHNENINRTHECKNSVEDHHQHEYGKEENVFEGSSHRESTQRLTVFSGIVHQAVQFGNCNVTS